jgi:hypothetical protein
MINATLSGVMLLPAVWADANHFGLMYRIGVWPPLAIVMGVFLIDLASPIVSSPLRRLRAGASSRKASRPRSVA